MCVIIRGGRRGVTENIGGGGGGKGRRLAAGNYHKRGGFQGGKSGGETDRLVVDS